ncbi:hypothetical protein GCK72_013234 [Caenorhabditis remanei]|uniref:Uncharacterized protein n=1 Tax=Caenorhabditis remanei TaxID=31234 RepID=A0A6A5GNB4_CAERE|nr:hypothetical protein GCK72_013234 [Caenorhabditis remanei]KAF1756780.1 hypothetical protein GCK72_013234 [Caenorhabditis remanei]
MDNLDDLAAHLFLEEVDEDAFLIRPLNQPQLLQELADQDPAHAEQAAEQLRLDFEEHVRVRFPGVDNPENRDEIIQRLVEGLQMRFMHDIAMNEALQNRDPPPQRNDNQERDPVQQRVPPLPARLHARFFGRPQEPEEREAIRLQEEAPRPAPVPMEQEQPEQPEQQDEPMGVQVHQGVNVVPQGPARYPLRVRQIIHLQVLPYDNSRYSEVVLLRSGMIEMYFSRWKRTGELKPIVEAIRLPVSEKLILPDGCTTNVGLWTTENINQWMTNFIEHPVDQEIIRRHRLTGLNCFHFLRPYARIDRYIMRTPLREERIRVFPPPAPEDPATPPIPEYAVRLLKAYYNKAYNLYNGHRR